MNLLYLFVRSDFSRSFQILYSIDSQKRHGPVVSALNTYLIVEVHRICSTEKVQQIRS